LYRYISDCRLCSTIWIKDKESVAKYSCKQSITIYQLAHLIIFELPKIIEQFSSTSKIIVIYYLLHLFVSDPHTDKVDAKNLTKEIASSLRKISKERLKEEEIERRMNDIIALGLTIISIKLITL
jgi:hypothetical protein